MSLLRSLILSPAIGVGLVTDFDKATGLFYILPPVGLGTWASKDTFTPLWTGDMVMYRTLDGHEAFGLVTHLDFDTWEIEVMDETGQTGYPHPSNVICVVGRDMPLLTETQQTSVSVNLAKLFVSKIVRFIPAMARR